MGILNEKVLNDTEELQLEIDGAAELIVSIACDTKIMKTTLQNLKAHLDSKEHMGIIAADESGPLKFNSIGMGVFFWEDCQKKFQGRARKIIATHVDSGSHKNSEKNKVCNLSKNELVEWLSEVFCAGMYLIYHYWVP